MTKIIDPWKPVFLSHILPGLGHYILGKKTKAFSFFISSTLITAILFYWLISPYTNLTIPTLFLTILFTVKIVMMVDTYRIAKYSNNLVYETKQAQTKSFWLACLLNLYIPGLGIIYLRKWLTGVLIITLDFMFAEAFSFSPSLKPIWSIILTFSVLRLSFSIIKPKPQLSAKLIISILLLISLTHPISIGIKKFCLQTSRIPSGSMIPTLYPGDRLIILKPFRYAPKRFDIVTFKRDKDYIKRVVGLPGEKVQYINGQLFINDISTPEPQIIPKNTDDFGPCRLKQDDYFLIGDNRAISKDSRQYGPTSKQAIFGKAWKIYWPIDHVALLGNL